MRLSWAPKPVGFFGLAWHGSWAEFYIVPKGPNWLPNILIYKTFKEGNNMVKQNEVTHVK